MTDLERSVLAVMDSIHAFADPAYIAGHVAARELREGRAAPSDEEVRDALGALLNAGHVKAAFWWKVTPAGRDAHLDELVAA